MIRIWGLLAAALALVACDRAAEDEPRHDTPASAVESETANLLERLTGDWEVVAADSQPCRVCADNRSYKGAVVRFTPDQLSWLTTPADGVSDICEGPRLAPGEPAATYVRAQPGGDYGNPCCGESVEVYEPQSPEGIEQARAFTVSCRSGEWGYAGAPLIVLPSGRLVQGWYSGALLVMERRSPPAR